MSGARATDPGSRAIALRRIETFPTRLASWGRAYRRELRAEASAESRVGWATPDIDLDRLLLGLGRDAQCRLS